MLSAYMATREQWCQLSANFKDAFRDVSGRKKVCLLFYISNSQSDSQNNLNKGLYQNLFKAVQNYLNALLHAEKTFHHLVFYDSATKTRKQYTIPWKGFKVLNTFKDLKHWKDFYYDNKTALTVDIPNTIGNDGFKFFARGRQLSRNLFAGQELFRFSFDFFYGSCLVSSIRILKYKPSSFLYLEILR